MKRMIVDIGILVKTLRAVNGLSQQEAAEKLGVSASYLSQVEHGRHVSLAFVKKVTLLFDVPLELLVAEEGEESSEMMEELRKVFGALLTSQLAQSASLEEAPRSARR